MKKNTERICDCNSTGIIYAVLYCYRQVRHFLPPKSSGLLILIGRIGRRTGLVLAMLGSLLSIAWVSIVLSRWGNILSLRYLLVGPMFQVVGGGACVALANIYSIVTDLVPEADRYVLYQFSLSMVAALMIVQNICLLSSYARKPDCVSSRSSNSIYAHAKWLPLG